MTRQRCGVLRRAAAHRATLTRKQNDRARHLLIPILAVMLAGCQGTLTTEAETSSSCTDEKGNAATCPSFEGIEIYRTTRLKQTSETRLIIEKGVIAASASAKPPMARCIPVKSVTYIVGADFHHPLILKYKPGLFEAYNFKASLSDGMLTSVGLDSTPDQGKTVSNILTPIASLVSSMKALPTNGASTPPPGPKACTDGPIVLSQEPG